jgi:hypothetical protein
MDLSELFDPYSRQARLQPALLTLLPGIISIAAIWPALYQGATALIGLVVTCGGLVALTHVARSAGKEHEKRLLRAWGGMPTTITLRHADSKLDSATKQRYKDVLSKSVPKWIAPTTEEERADGAVVDERYVTAVKWLLEQTRGNKLVLKENISYGFRRNLRGLRVYGIAISGASLLASAFVAGMRLPALDPMAVASCVLALGALLAFPLVVTDDWVREAGDNYAIRLLACCDALPALAKGT